MIEIEPKQLWLGNALDIREPQPLFEAEIAAVVDVAFEEPPAQLPREFIYLRIPLNDGGGNEPTRLKLAVQSLVDLLQDNTRTIIACSAGMSRSPTIASFALAVFLGTPPKTALQRIAAVRSLEIKPTLWADVAAILSSVKKSR